MFDNASDLDKIVKEKNAPTERNIPQKMKCTAWCTRTLIYCDSRDKEEIYVSNTCSSPRVNIRRYDAIRKVVRSFFLPYQHAPVHEMIDKTKLASRKHLQNRAQWISKIGVITLYRLKTRNEDMQMNEIFISWSGSVLATFS